MSKTRAAPVGRTTRMSFYSPGGESPSVLGSTWIESESFAYPNGGFTRRAYVRMGDGALRIVRVSIPDTYFTIPARARVKGKTVRGFVSVDSQAEVEEYRFTEVQS